MTLVEQLKEAEKIPGLKEHLDAFTEYKCPKFHHTFRIVDILCKSDEQLAAYVIEEKKWLNSMEGGIENNAVVGIYQNGKYKISKYNHRHMFDPKKDNPDNDFIKIEKISSLENGRLHIALYSANGQETWLSLPGPQLNSLQS